ncbi:MAG: hypothetical protein R3F59_27915 [Myxococcota bacterium]
MKRRPADRRAAAAALAKRRAAVRASLRGRTRQQDRKGRRWLVLAVILAVLLALLCQCREDPPPPEELPGEGVLAVGVPAPPAPPPAPEEPPGAVARKPRPAFEGEPPARLPWLGAFRMQVAARSPRLAACFVGATAPGRLKWTASVAPATGQVSEHVFESVLGADELTQAQRTCVVDVLSDPTYRLAADERATPSRVSMVIEF